MQAHFFEPMARRQPTVRDAHGTEDFQRADVNRQRLGMDHRTVAFIDDADARALAGQFGGGGQPDRTRADDQHITGGVWRGRRRGGRHGGRGWMLRVGKYLRRLLDNSIRMNTFPLLKPGDGLFTIRL